MPPDSTDRFLTAPVRAVRSSKKHLHLASCQRPARRLLKLPKPPRPPRPPGLSKTLGPLGPPEPPGPLGP